MPRLSPTTALRCLVYQHCLHYLILVFLSPVKNLSQKTNSETCSFTLSVIKQIAGFLNHFNFFAVLTHCDFSHCIYPQRQATCCWWLFLFKKKKRYPKHFVIIYKLVMLEIVIIAPAATRKTWTHSNNFCFGFSIPKMQNETFILIFTFLLYIRKPSDVSGSLMNEQS